MIKIYTKWPTEYDDSDGYLATILQEFKAFECVGAKDRYMAHHKLFLAQYFGLNTSFDFTFEGGEKGVYAPDFREIHVDIVSRGWEAYKKTFEIHPSSLPILERMKKIAGYIPNFLRTNTETKKQSEYVVWRNFATIVYLWERKVPMTEVIKYLEFNRYEWNTKKFLVFASKIPKRKTNQRKPLGVKKFAAKQKAVNE